MPARKPIETKATQGLHKGKGKMAKKGKVVEQSGAKHGAARLAEKPGGVAAEHGKIDAKRPRVGEKRQRTLLVKETKKDRLKAALRERLVRAGKRRPQKLKIPTKQPIPAIQASLGQESSSGLPSKMKRKVSKIVEDNHIQVRKKRKLSTPPTIVSDPESEGGTAVAKVATASDFSPVVKLMVTSFRFGRKGGSLPLGSSFLTQNRRTKLCMRRRPW